MKFIRVNRYIQIKNVETEENDNGILLPQGYQKKEEPYQTVVVLGVSDMVRIMVVPGDKIIVDRKMIEEIKTEEFGTISLILDNYVVGIVPKGS